jgi:hypothetical protein
MFKSGNIIVCIDNNLAPKLYIGKEYEILFINENYVIINEGHYIIDRFVSKTKYRKIKINNIFNEKI